MQVAVASVDASISGVAVELHQCSLRRSTAAVPLLPRLLAASTADTTAFAGGSFGNLEQQAAAVMAAGSSAWVEVLALEPEPPTPASHPGKQQQREEAKLAVSFRYFNTTGAHGDASSSSSSGGKTVAGGQLRCAVSLGRLLVAHSPGFATNLLLFAGQYGAANARANSAAVAKHSSSNGGDGPADGGSTSTSRRASPVKPAAATGSVAAAQQEAGGPSLLEQALQPQQLLECRVAQVQLAALASQAPGAAAVALLLQQPELRSGALNWGQPWNSHLRNALLAPAHGELADGSSS